MQRTVIVSNRLPIKISNKEDQRKFQRSEGGLATGLNSFLSKGNNIWVGWPGVSFSDEDRKKEVSDLLQKQKMFPIFLTEEEVKEYYEGFCNETIWPTFHYFNQYALYNDQYWKRYVEVNQKFAEVLENIIQTEDTIWVHDYQLMLLPHLLREKFPEAAIGFFQHIPFPSYEIFRLLPWRKKLLEGILGADLVGFHTFDDMRHFLSSVNRLLGKTNLYGKIDLGERNVQVDAFPMGIDFDKYSKLSNSAATYTRIKKYRETFKEEKIILSIDRLDYSKGIPQRLLAFEQFLKNFPEFHEKVSLMMIVVPSRDQVDKYKELKEKIDQLVGRINSSFRTISWNPIQYFYRSFSINALVALYKTAEVALVTPLRDGMNLVCKEYIASKNDESGVLILSEMAGASKELADAILINPNDISQMVEAIKSALTMDDEEKIVRMRNMQQTVKKYNVLHWAALFLQRLEETCRQRDPQVRYMDTSAKEKLFEAYKIADSRLIFLDYDGTLIPFMSQPYMAKPDNSLIEILLKLSSDPKNRIVIISGRDKNTLETWLGSLNVDLIAEHGIWLKEKGTEWSTIHGINNTWKKDIRPVFELYVSRTPGAFIEEKEYSLVWHYRGVEPGLAELRSRELISHLTYLASNINLQVLEGDKVVEIKNIDVNKGKASSHWLEKFPSDFIFAAGDDRTDEDTFMAMPQDAFAIKVGDGKTVAKHSVASNTQLREILQMLANSNMENFV